MEGLMSNSVIEAFKNEIYRPDSDIVSCVEETMKKLDSAGDANLPAFMSNLQKMKSDKSLYEIRVTLRALSRIIKPKNYLEIGTRRGWSLAQVLAEASSVKVVSFDLWVPQYAGSTNPGPDFLKSEMMKIVGAGVLDIKFVCGNSHDTFPEYFRSIKSSGLKYDIITVDGDHTLQGAWWDLVDVMPIVSVGGAIVFDDLDYEGDEKVFGVKAESKYRREPMPKNIRTLTDVWNEIKKTHPNFVFLDNLKGIPPVGFGVRVS